MTTRLQQTHGGFSHSVVVQCSMALIFEVREGTSLTH